MTRPIWRAGLLLSAALLSARSGVAVEPGSGAEGVAPAAVAPPALASPALELEEVLASAERVHPAMLAAELERRAAAGDLESAEGGFDVSWKARGTVTPKGYYDNLRAETAIEKPTALWGASVFASWRLGAGEFPAYDGRLETLDFGEARAGVQLPLWRNGPTDRRRANLERARLGLQIAELSIRQQKLELRRAAAQRYWAWVAAGRRVAIGEALLGNVERRDAGIGLRVETGDLPPIERIENQRALAQRRAGLAQARRGLEHAAIELGLFLRGAGGEPMVPGPGQLPASFPEVPALEALEPISDARIARERRPEAHSLELQRRQQAVELDWAHNQLAPAIDVQLALARDFGPRQPARPDLSETVVEASVLLELPIQTRAMQGRVEAALANAERLRARARLAGDRIDADVRDAHSAIGAARERIEATRREVALALELEAGERARFEQGDSNLLLVNLREQQTAEAQLREIDALLDYYRARADLAAARGS
jgi:outer membrane protein, heavy metal efflux system